MDNKNALVYGIISTGIVSIASLTGVAFLPLIRGKNRTRWMNFFLALAISTLSADAILHLLPQVMGVHKHGHSHVGHGHGHENGYTNGETNGESGTKLTCLDFFTKFCDECIASDKRRANDDLVCISILDNCTSRYFPKTYEPSRFNDMTDFNNHNHDNHNHNHDGNDRHHFSDDNYNNDDQSSHKFDDNHDHDEDKKIMDHSNDETVENQKSLIKLTFVVVTIYFLYIAEYLADNFFINRNQKVYNHEAGLANNESNDETNSQIIRSEKNVKTTLDELPVIFWGIKSVAITILFGDGLHNFIDGVAIGSSFAVSTRLGVTTSIAIFCHELPHEIGDFVVLLESGLSIPKAMILNFISAITAFGGLFIGLAAIQVEYAVEVMLAITVGMFLYVAWLDLLVHLKHAARNDKWYISLSLQIIGLSFGIAIMFLIAWYEDKFFH